MRLGPPLCMKYLQHNFRSNRTRIFYFSYNFSCSVSYFIKCSSFPIKWFTFFICPHSARILVTGRLVQVSATETPRALINGDRYAVSKSMCSWRKKNYRILCEWELNFHSNFSLNLIYTIEALSPHYIKMLPFKNY